MAACLLNNSFELVLKVFDRPGPYPDRMKMFQKANGTISVWFNPYLCMDIHFHSPNTT